MERREFLLDKLKRYGESEVYPFHMPGHKRQTGERFAAEFPNPFSIDITEIDGFDNLHHPEGILRESMEWAAEIYGADRTYYLINGSSCGILSAVCGTTEYGGSILMSRNCHKSAYHGVFLNGLQAVYSYPQTVEEFGLAGGLSPDETERLLITHPEISAVLVVSPTYDGIVSDIEEISKVVHGFGLPLIVDEAHGAHFPFGKTCGFPVSALELGADVVIQSLHKTLPSFTQTAVMHVKEGYVDIRKIDRYVHMFQSSSPSYVLMAGIENCIRFMDEDGRALMGDYARRLGKVRKKLAEMKNLRLVTDSIIGKNGVFDLDCSKIVVSSRGTGITGAWLSDCLREQYHLEMEMCGADYVTAITSVADTDEGLERLCGALCEIDKTLGRNMEDGDITPLYREGKRDKPCVDRWQDKCSPSVEKHPGNPVECGKPDVVMTVKEAVDAPKRKIRLEESAGLVSAEFIYLYPPGIPMIAPGELLTGEMVSLVMEYQEAGLPVQGPEDETVEWIWVVGCSGVS